MSLPGVQSNRKQMAIIIEDLPFYYEDLSLEDVQQLNENLFAHLASHKVQATAFAVTQKLEFNNEVQQRSAILKRWVQNGHVLANHTHTHRGFSGLSVDECKQDMLICHDKLLQIMGVTDKELTSRFFLYPFLDTGKSAEERQAFERFLADQQYLIAPVTLLTGDWVYAKWYAHALKTNQPADLELIKKGYLAFVAKQIQFYEQASQQLFARDIPQICVLQANQLNAASLGDVLALMKALGYDFVPLAQAVKDEVYQRANPQPNRSGSMFNQWDTANIIDPATKPKLSLVEDVLATVRNAWLGLQGAVPNDAQKEAILNACTQRFGKLFMEGKTMIAHPRYNKIASFQEFLMTVLNDMPGYFNQAAPSTVDALLDTAPSYTQAYGNEKPKAQDAAKANVAEDVGKKSQNNYRQ